jgi:hypothetical protein
MRSSSSTVRGRLRDPGGIRRLRGGSDSTLIVHYYFLFRIYGLFNLLYSKNNLWFDEFRELINQLINRLVLSV